MSSEEALPDVVELLMLADHHPCLVARQISSLSLAQLIALKPKMDMILCEILYCRWRQLGEEGISCAALDGR